MPDNKRLFFEYKDNKASLKAYLLCPVSFPIFLDFIKDVALINFSSKKFIKDFYKKYSTELFPFIILKHPKEYSKYFWRTACLGLDFPPSSDDFYLSRGWSNEEMLSIRKSKYATGTIEFQTKALGLSESEAHKKLNARQEVIKYKRKETYKKYLKEDPDYFKKKCGYSVDHFIDKGFSKEVSELKSKEIGSKVSVKNRQWAKDTKESDPVYWSSRTETQLNYWINKGFNKKESRKILKDRQTTFNLEKCVEKYGIKLGLIKWKKRNKEWSIKIEEMYSIGLFSRKSTNLLNNRYSKISLVLFNDIVNYLNIEASFGINEKFIIFNKKHLYPDFMINNKIIEFNGDYWHANPLIYNKDFIFNMPYGKTTANEIWQKDKYKNEALESMGYKVMVVWESDYYKHPETILNKCIEFLID